MINIDVTKEDILLINKYINKTILHTIIFHILIIVFVIPFFYCLTKNYFKIWYISLIDIVLLGIWICSCFYSIIKLIKVKKSINNNTITKICENFIVIDKEKLTQTFENSSDTNYYYLKLISEETKKKKKLFVEKENYMKLDKNHIISIVYFEKLNFVLEAKSNNFLLKESSF